MEGSARVRSFVPFAVVDVVGSVLVGLYVSWVEAAIFAVSLASAMWGLALVLDYRGIADWSVVGRRTRFNKLTRQWYGAAVLFVFGAIAIAVVVSAVIRR
jgi:hypothetical protein